MEDDEQVALDPNFVPEGWLLDYPSSPANSKHLSSSPPAKKKKLSLSLSKKDRTSQSTSRFAPPVSEVQYVEAAKGVVPTNTRKSNACAFLILL